jgi:hypothetical protein
MCAMLQACRQTTFPDKAAGVPTAFPVFVPNYHTDFLRFSAPSRLFLPLALRLQAASLREISHMQAGQ